MRAAALAVLTVSLTANVASADEGGNLDYVPYDPGLPAMPYDPGLVTVPYDPGLLSVPYDPGLPSVEP